MPVILQLSWLRLLGLGGLFIIIISQPLAQLSAADAGRSKGRHRLRVMSYNMHVGIGLDQKLDLARIAAVINEAQPDLVGLQEVDRGVERTNRVDQIAELARLTKLEFAFAPNRDYQGGKYGVAILSRYPILAREHRRYENPLKTEQRGFLRVEVKIKGQRLNFVTTHLDPRLAAGRLAESEQLLQALKLIKTPLLVVGDFNDEPTGETYRLMLTRLADAWTPTETDPQGFSFSADRPRKRIDYIFYTLNRGLRPKAAWVMNSPASDHLPLLAEFALGR